MAAQPRSTKSSPAQAVWSEREHAAFLDALQLYQRDWLQIAAHIGPSKTPAQTRVHANEYLEAAKREGGAFAAVRPSPRRAAAARLGRRGRTGLTRAAGAPRGRRRGRSGRR
jgi:SHAQKYF class myb-like DNA-binding protein